MSQKVSTLERTSGAGSNSRLKTSARPRSPASMMGTVAWASEPAQHGVGVLGVAQVPGAVEGAQARHGQARGVADVVQPGGGFQETGVRTENRGQAACLRGDALDVRPAAREGLLKECPGELLRP